MANRFWVGGTGNWSDTARWSATSGGASGASVPTSADDVFFDANSAGANYTVTVNSTTRNCRNLTATAPASGNLTMSNSGSITLNVAGSLSLYAGMTWSQISGAALNFTATTSQTVDTAGVSIGSNITFNGSGGQWTLLSNLTQPNNQSLTLTAGSLIFNGFTVTTSFFASSGSGTRTLNISGSTFVVNNANQSLAAWNTGTTTNLTFTVSGSTVTVNANNNVSSSMTSPLTFNPGGLTFNNLTFSTTSYTPLALTSSCTVSGVFTTQGGNANSQRLMLRSNTRGTARTITCNGSVALSNTDYEDIIINGSASPASGTSLGDCGNCTGITFTSPVNRYWVGNAGSFDATTNWAATSGGASGASMPLPQDTAFFDANSFSIASQNINWTGQNNFRMGTLDFTGVTNSPIFNIDTDVLIYGSATFTSGVVWGGVDDLILSGRGTHTFNQGQISSSSTYDVNCVSGSYTMTGNVCSSPAASKPNITITSGSFDADVYDLHVNSVTGTGSTARTLSMGSGTWFIYSFLTVWNFGTTTNLTFNRDTSTIEFINSSANTVTFAGGGLTYFDVVINRGAGTGIFSITGNNTFNILQSLTSAAYTLRIAGSSTQTFESFEVSGSSGNIVTIESSSASAYNFVYTGADVVDVDYISISRSQATPAVDTWYAGSHSTDGGSNTGWIFDDAPVSGSGQLIFWN